MATSVSYIFFKGWVNVNLYFDLTKSFWQPGDYCTIVGNCMNEMLKYATNEKYTNEKYTNEKYENGKYTNEKYTNEKCTNEEMYKNEKYTNEKCRKQMKNVQNKSIRMKKK